ncbi:terpene synthase 10-like isoform X1 [Benincasa hispida]|uniref:terpene synthase 10-like isoform X1 n=1 Tax=Benincasa hispida TaxID=102211 RepID=UPI001900AE50|nr:terpene synthase 10-like isoform X1 [Benincasa hispida]
MRMSILHLPLPLYPPISHLTSTQSNLPSSPNFYVLCQMDKTSMVLIRKVSHNFIVRRSANYRPPIWKHEFIQSLKSEFMEERCFNKRNMLIRRLKMMLNKELLIGDSLKGLEVVDELKRLGLSYHFQMEINQILESMNEKFQNGGEGLEWKNKSLYATSLHFRISRQHGYHIPLEVFNRFRDELENLDSICEEKAKGMLSFYEASFLAMEDESFMDEARQFAVRHLSKYLKSNNNDEIICTMISHALELPLHWRMPRLEARWFIDVYQKKPEANSMLLELAKLDFNVIQSIHLDDLKDVSRWWKSTGLGEKLEFARDRLMANFFWSVGMGCEPHLGYLRTMSTKIASLITIIDDVYDVYGTLDELELFTDVVERWDIAAIDSLPNYMKICFIALHNTINDMTFHAAKDHGVNVIQYFKKMWIDLCKKAFLVEAKWYYTNYKPTFQEYLDNAWISVSGSLLLLHAYVFATNSITIEALECLQDYPHIIQHSSVIFCLANDLASSSEEAKRGEVTKSIQCYMNDTGASEQEARRCIKDFIMESWKKMNEEVQTLNSSPLFSKGFIEIALNLARVSHTVYQHRDGHTVEDYETMDRVLSLFIEPA